MNGPLGYKAFCPFFICLIFKLHINIYAQFLCLIWTYIRSDLHQILNQGLNKAEVCAIIFIVLFLNLFFTGLLLW